MSNQHDRNPAKDNSGASAPPPSKIIEPEYSEPSIPDWMFKIVDIKRKDSSVHHQQSNEEQSEPNNALVDRIKRSDRWMIGLTAIIAVSAIGNIVVFRLESRGTSKQIDKVIEQVTNQSTNTEMLAAATKDLAFASTNQVKELQASVKATQASADAAKRSTQIAERTLNQNIDAVRLEQRAWVGIGNLRMIAFELNKPVRLDVSFRNSGKTFARNVNFFNSSTSGPDSLDLSIPMRFMHPSSSAKGPIDLGPNAAFAYPFTVYDVLTTDQMPLFINKSRYFYFCGRVTYSDIFDRPQFFEFCGRYEIESKDFRVRYSRSS